MEKNILNQYVAAKGRAKYLHQAIVSLDQKLERFNGEGYVVADTVTCGKKGKKSLGTVLIKGVPVPEYEKLKKHRERRVAQQNEELLQVEALVEDVEKFIASVDDMEMRNLLDLYYIEDLTWVQVAHRMNSLYGKKAYTEGSCRQKVERFLEK